MKIVTLTVTEKGYCHDPATAALDEAHPDIVHDLANPARPRTAPGFLVEALRRRRAAHEHAVHGAVLRQPSAQRPHGRAAIVTRFAALRDPALAGYIAQRGRVPVHHGRPHHAGDHRRATARRSRRGSASRTPRRW